MAFVVEKRKSKETFKQTKRVRKMMRLLSLQTLCVAFLRIVQPSRQTPHQPDCAKQRGSEGAEVTETRFPPSVALR